VQPPTASWGNMLGQSLGNLRNGWWLGLFPGLALVTVLIAANIIVEKAQQRP
jgi:peptide/nickel transport system permease protein